MSDVTVAPAGSAPPAAQNEVVIDQNPVTPPAPIGSQAPQAPTGDIKGSEHRPPSRRESIQAAFERANNPKTERPKPEAKPEAKPADAKPGHNNPPEKTEKTEPLDLKKRPADQPKTETEQPRDRGRFAPREQQPQAPRVAKQLPANAPYRDPPVRMAEHGKRDWADTPESVRGEVHRVQNEFAKAYKYYKDDYEAFKPVKQFHKMAQEHGTTLEKALTNYVSMEQKLRADPVGGLDVIVSNLNLRSADGQKLGLRDIAYHILSQTPDQLKQIQQGNAQSAANQQIGALHQEIVDLKNTLKQMHTQQQFTYTRSAVDQYADSHPRFDELGDLIEAELKLGFDLETAYRRAELLRPTAHAAQTRTPSAQTRPADKSISGHPGVTPSNGASRSEKPIGRREAIQSAIRRQAGGL
jgi:hypothetical protein